MTQFRSHKAVQEYLANRGRITLLFSGVVVTVSILLFFYIWQYTKMVEIQIAIREVQKHRKVQNEQLENLQVERAKLMAIARIESLAREKLGMVAPSRANIQFLTRGGMVCAPKDRPIEPVHILPPPGAPTSDSPGQAPQARAAATAAVNDPLSERQIDDVLYAY